MIKLHNSLRIKIHKTRGYHEIHKNEQRKTNFNKMNTMSVHGLG